MKWAAKAMLKDWWYLRLSPEEQTRRMDKYRHELLRAPVPEVPDWRSDAQRYWDSMLWTQKTLSVDSFEMHRPHALDLLDLPVSAAEVPESVRVVALQRRTEADAAGFEEGRLKLS